MTTLRQVLRRGAGGFAVALIFLFVSSLAEQASAQQIPAPQVLGANDAMAAPEASSTATLTQTAQPSAPEVTYLDGQLAIRSQGSTLAEVLKAVAQKTGAVIEVPAGGGLERVFERAGPANTDSVLRSLLTGSDFNFVILTPPQTPHRPARVLLFARVAGSAGADDSAVAAAEGSPDNEPQLYGAGFVVSSEEESAEEAAPPPAAEPDKPDALPGPVLDQMQKDFLKQHELQRQQQQQQQQQGGAPPSQ